MGNHTCPWWLGYLLICPFRLWHQNPASILQPYVRQDMTVFEPGPGMGFFTVELARQVGPSGRVVAVDIQPRMLSKLQKRLTKAGLADRVDVRLVKPDSLGIDDLQGKIDLTLAFYMVHEMPSASSFFQQAAAAMKPGASLLLAEPRGHVKNEDFESELRAADQAGLKLLHRPKIGRNLIALLQKAA